MSPVVCKSAGRGNPRPALMSRTVACAVLVTSLFGLPPSERPTSADLSNGNAAEEPDEPDAEERGAPRELAACSGASGIA